jgi:hypothetical protein
LCRARLSAKSFYAEGPRKSPRQRHKPSAKPEFPVVIIGWLIDIQKSYAGFVSISATHLVFVDPLPKIHLIGHFLNPQSLFPLSLAHLSLFRFLACKSSATASPLVFPGSFSCHRRLASSASASPLHLMANFAIDPLPHLPPGFACTPRAPPYVPLPALGSTLVVTWIVPMKTLQLHCLRRRLPRKILSRWLVLYISFSSMKRSCSRNPALCYLGCLCSLHFPAGARSFFVGCSSSVWLVSASVYQA